MLIRVAKVLNVSTDYLLGLDDHLRIDVQGLPAEFVAHLNLLIRDYLEMAKKAQEKQTEAVTLSIPHISIKVSRQGHRQWLPCVKGKRSAVAGVNDSPVGCQSRDRIARRQLSAEQAD